MAETETGGKGARDTTFVSGPGLLRRMSISIVQIFLSFFLSSSPVQFASESILAPTHSSRPRATRVQQVSCAPTVRRSCLFPNPLAQLDEATKAQGR